MVYRGMIKRPQVFLLTGKVACGKTTYAREQLRDHNAILLSLDELQLGIFGANPTRDQLDSTFKGCSDYQKSLAVQLLNLGIDVYIDWGFWKKDDRVAIKAYFKKERYAVQTIFFDTPYDIRMARNAKRNSGQDDSSFKIEEKDVRLFDSFYEEPSEDEYDVIIRSWVRRWILNLNLR